MKKQKPTQRNSREEYLKRVNNLQYKKSLHRNISLFDTYNLVAHGGKIKHYVIRDVAKYFAEDIKNPIGEIAISTIKADITERERLAESSKEILDNPTRIQ